MSAAECFINFLHNHSAQESHQVQSTLQLSLVQHKERQNSPFPCLSSISKPHISPQKLPAAQGVFTHSSSLATRMKEGPGLRGQLQVKLAIFPGFDMPRHLIFLFFSPEAKHTQNRTELQRFTPAHYFSVVLNPKLRSQSDLLTVEISELQVNASVGRICRGSFNIPLPSKGSCDPENQMH